MRKLIKKILREWDELDWIRDTQPISYEDLLGKALHFQPLIDNSEDLRRILDFLETLGFDAGADIKYFEEYIKHLEGLYLNPITNMVTWTTDLSSSGKDYREHISNYANRPVEVLDGWQTLEDYIRQG